MSEKEVCKCPLCGKQFFQSEMKCGAGCLLSKHCDLICCPHCGYSYREKSQMVDWFKKWVNKRG